MKRTAGRPVAMEADEEQVDEIKESMSDDEEDDKDAKVGRLRITGSSRSVGRASSGRPFGRGRP